MCDHCGCSTPTGHADDHTHPHEHPHHEHGTAHVRESRVVPLQHNLLAKNSRMAEANRRWLRERGIVAINLVASPGAGKTTLLEQTVRRLGPELPLAVIEADPATDHDAARLRALGCRVVQLNTDTGCHLDADMVRRGLDELRPEPNSLVFFENVGNLVCPAMFDLGETKRVVVASLPEGEDKPVKYPHIFRSSDAMVLNKIDLWPYLRFDVAACIGFARQVNREIVILEVSAARGDGIGSWCEWLRDAGRVPSAGRR